MAAMAGTQLAKRVLEETGLARKATRVFTERRKTDRSFKIWAPRLSRAEAETLVAALADAGAEAPRIVHGFGYSGIREPIGGVRFEYEE